MQGRPDYSLIPNAERAHPAWARFRIDAAGKQLNAEFTRELWEFFRAGWDSCTSVTTAAMGG